MVLRQILVAAVVILLIEPLTLSAQDAAAPVTTSERFTFYSDARVSLHHFLIVWASADADEWPGYAEPIIEREQVDRLADDERVAWNEALAAYGTAVGRSHVFDQGLIAMRDWAAGHSRRDAVPEEDQAWVTALELALPVYEKHWWSQHDAGNRAWIRDVTALLANTEQNIAGRLEHAYGARWPEDPIPVDAVPYANDVGAFSTGGRLTIASPNPGNQAPQSLELVFHEASHVDELEIPLRRLVTEAYRAEGGQAPNRLWHDLIFFTTGEITAIALEAEGEEYTHYGHATGVYRRGERWAGQLPAFEEWWRPFLRSQRSSEDRASAFQGVARALMGR